MTSSYSRMERRSTDMNAVQRQRLEAIQKTIARAVATNPAGRNLVLIGGFRYRLLDESVRTSDDIDYHWGGDLAEKQRELVALFRRSVLPEVRRRFHMDGQADPLTGPDADSPAVRIVDLAFWQAGTDFGRIEIPVELTRIPCADPIAVRTAGGTIYPTVSEADMIESKILAIFNRLFLKHRDIVDVFLFHDRLLPDSKQRLRAKLQTLNLPLAAVKKTIADLRQHADYHSRAIQAVIDTQLDTVVAEQMKEAGGGKTVLNAVLSVLHKHLPAKARTSDESP
jgi:hypothetical protein